MFKLVERQSVKGADEHHMGWPAVVSALKRRCFGTEGIALLDDFVEQTVDEIANIKSRPRWAGIFHHPRGRNHPAPNEKTLAQYFLRDEHTRRFFLSMRLAITLSEDLAEFLRELLPDSVPVRAMKHPITPSPTSIEFDPDCLRDRLRVVQVGTYMRNLRAILQLPADPSWKRLRTAVPVYYGPVDLYLEGLHRRPEHSNLKAPVIGMPRLTSQAYDSMLSRSVVFVEYYDASASNTVLECIDRATPILLNRLPAHEEYLGAGYPGFYDRFEQAADILRDRQRLLAAHQYLKDMDKWPFDLGHFCDEVAETVWRHFRPMAPVSP